MVVVSRVGEGLLPWGVFPGLLQGKAHIKQKRAPGWEPFFVLRIATYTTRVCKSLTAARAGTTKERLRDCVRPSRLGLLASQSLYRRVVEHQVQVLHCRARKYAVRDIGHHAGGTGIKESLRGIT